MRRRVLQEAHVTRHTEHAADFEVETDEIEFWFESEA
jgi:hypothetical protein